MPSKKTDKDGKTPKHGMDKDRSNKEVGYMRSAATVKRLKMYNKGAPVRDKKGKFVSQDLQSRDLPTTRIQPDRRWFGNTRVIGQAQLESFRGQMADKVDNPFMVLLRDRKLPMQLLEDPEARVDKKRKRKEVLAQMNFSETFGAKPNQRRKKPKLSMESFGAMIEQADDKDEKYLEKNNGEVDAFALQPAKYSLVREQVLNKGQSKRIWAELYKVIDSSDVIIQVLDARDPNGTRCAYLEQHLKKHHKHKHLLFVLNKVDLVPQWNVKRWLHCLSKEYPTLAFHASVTNPFGKGALLSLLRQLARLRSDKKAIAIGFVGYPNVGKSSVINTLRTKKVCVVAPIPGQTKVWQYISLMKRVHLIDCPGVVYNEAGDSQVDTVLKGVVRIERLEDATSYVPDVLARIKAQYIKRAYKVEGWEDAEDLLTQIAKKTGKLLKGGDADLNTAAKMVLLDWQRGRLAYYSTPPGYSAEAPSKREALEAQTDAPSNAVTAEEATGDAEGNPQLASAAAEALVESALAAAAAQQGGVIPMRSDYFMDEDAGPDTGEVAAGRADDAADVISDDENDDEDDDEDSDKGADAAAAGPSAAADSDDEGTGYAAGDLSWEAVMAQVMGGGGASAGAADSDDEDAGAAPQEEEPEEDEGPKKKRKRTSGGAAANAGVKRPKKTGRAAQQAMGAKAAGSKKRARKST